MHQFFAADPQAVTALIEEHLPPAVRGIVDGYSAGPELWSNAPDGPINAAQITIKWHQGFGDGDGDTEKVFNALMLSSTLSYGWLWTHDRGLAGCDYSRIVIIRKGRQYKFSHPNHALLHIPSVTVSSVLIAASHMLAFSTLQISISLLDLTDAPAQLVDIRTGHYTLSPNSDYYQNPAVQPYIKYRANRGCKLGDESCVCEFCSDEIHHMCRRRNSPECRFLKQCACACAYCGSGPACGDARGLCPNQGTLCFSKWKPPNA